MYVYLMTNMVNGKYYVGKTIKDSLDQYLADAASMAIRGKNNRPLLHRAIRKYGADSFVIEPLAECETNADASNLERLWIILLSSKNHTIGYNLSDGGEGSPGCKHSLEVRQRWSEQRKGKKAWNKGLTGIHTEDGKRRMVAARTGENNHFFGKHHSDSAKQSIATSNSKRVWTEESRKKMSDSKKAEWALRKSTMEAKVA